MDAIQQVEDRLAALACERARTLAPSVFAATALALVLSESAGVPVGLAVLLWNAVSIPALAALAWALHKRRIRPARGHVALAALWLLAIGGTLVALLSTHERTVIGVLILECVAAAIAVSIRWTLVGYVLIDMALIVDFALVGIVDGPAVGLVASAQVFGLLFQRLVWMSLRRAEEQRLLREEVARELAQQLAELRRSEQEREVLSQQLQRAQRMEVAGTLASGLAHDMNNILSSIKTLAELSIAHPDAGRADDLKNIVAQADRGAELTRSLLAFSRKGQYRKQVLHPDLVISDLAPIMTSTVTSAVDLQLSLGAPDQRIDGDASQLQQVILNLVVNARDALQGGGVLALSTRSVTKQGQRWYELRVSDTGSGMDEATRLRVFEPFFTTKPVGAGTGLGLSLAWGVVQAHGGEIRVESGRGSGTTFIIELPCTDAPAPAATAPTPHALPTTSRGTVLVVDDEPLVRSTTRRLLERKGYSVLEASNGVEALSAFDKKSGEVDLVLLDMTMPVMSGPECFDALRERGQVPVLLLTGYASDAAAQALFARGAALMEKPYSSRDLYLEVERLLCRS